MADRRLRAFHAVAKHLSFTKAADALFMTQPSVTFQVKQLEEQFDTRLFDRTQGRITLTPAGAMALQYADRILELYAEMEARMSEMTGQEAGPLLIGASTTLAEFLLPHGGGIGAEDDPDLHVVALTEVVDHAAGIDAAAGTGDREDDFLLFLHGSRYFVPK